MILLESEGPGHSTTAGVENIVLEAEIRQDRFVGFVPHDGLVMTVALNERAADRDLAIVRTVGGIQGSAAVIKADLAANASPQIRFQRRNVEG